MKTVLRIARLELSVLFFSPIAWLVLIIFLFQTGLTYLDLLQGMEASQYMGYPLADITASIYSGEVFGLFSTVQNNLFLYIPLLTMGLISRETSSESIKLLLSSPVSIPSIVLGKFFAMMAYGLLLVVILIGYCIAGWFAIKSFDIGIVLSALLGLYLLICAYAAIGLFMSSLTSYQVVAAVSTLVIFAALKFVGTIWQNIDFVRDITYFLSIAGRTDQIIQGLITSNAICYFLIIVILFLALTILRLKDAREVKPAIVSAFRYVSLVALLLVAGYISSRPALTWYYDATATKQKTLTKNTQDIIKKIKGPLTINTFVNFVDDNYWYGLPSQRNADQAFFDPYLRFMPDMKINYFHYYDTTANKNLFYYNPGLNFEQIARRTTESNEFDFNKLLKPGDVNKIADLRTEEGRFTRQFVANGKTSFVRIFNDVFRVPHEAEIAAGLKRLVTAGPVVAFVTTNNTRSALKSGDKDYRTLAYELTSRSSLMNKGFEVINISLDSTTIPEGISALILADPTTPLSALSLSRIKDFVDIGGNLLIAGEVGRQAVLQPLLKELGVAFIEGKLYAKSEILPPDVVRTSFAKESVVLSPAMEKYVRNSSVVTTPGAVGLNYRKDGAFTIQPLLVTDSKDTWNRLRILDVDTGKVAFEPALGDDNKSVPVALALTRKINNREQRIIVAGDADFMSNAELGRNNMVIHNFLFLEKIFHWFSYGEFPVDVDRPEPPDDKILVSKSTIGRMRIFFLGALPAILLISATALLVIRKRR